MKILITGACGYVGSALFAHLSAAEYTVDAVDLKLSKDYRDLTSAFLSDYDTIIHLAAHSSVAQCKKDQWGAVDNNLIGFIGLLAKLPGSLAIGHTRAN